MFRWARGVKEDISSVGETNVVVVSLTHDAGLSGFFRCFEYFGTRFIYQKQGIVFHECRDIPLVPCE